MKDQRTPWGEESPPFLLARIGRWAAFRKVTRRVGKVAGRRVADLGCGYEATFMRPLLGEVEHATLIDFRVSDDLKQHPHVTAIEGELPDVLARIEDASLDVVICISVLEHIWDDTRMLEECRRILVPGGVLYVHVPSWRGKRPLEIQAFRFGLGAEEMQDHKRYYDPRDLWPRLRAAGFMPGNITCRRHQFGFSTFAVCRA